MKCPKCGSDKGEFEKRRASSSGAIAEVVRTGFPHLSPTVNDGLTAHITEMQGIYYVWKCYSCHAR